jgi:hypothetical protein
VPADNEVGYARILGMAKGDRSEFIRRSCGGYQADLISRYYGNLDTIMLQKLGELVSELYLADTDKKRDRLWQRVEKAMKNLNVPPAIIAHIMQKKNVEILAKNLQDWLAKSKK